MMIWTTFCARIMKGLSLGDRAPVNFRTFIEQDRLPSDQDSQRHEPSPVAMIVFARTGDAWHAQVPGSNGFGIPCESTESIN